MPQLSPTSGIMIFFMVITTCFLLYILFSMKENSPVYFLWQTDAKILSVF
uniref:Synthase F0 subunit 8 n=1 Tax=Biomphalaria tenagophila TaxID=112528 RepID=A9XIJ1_BIOTE|nr:ATP synthase F0 subunit 8 [Biomphalaria tenagophila]ABO14138.1 synthase F0 subunit 8 [Biomphalaria tenagophila]